MCIQFQNCLQLTTDKCLNISKKKTSINLHTDKYQMAQSKSLLKTITRLIFALGNSTKDVKVCGKNEMHLQIYIHAQLVRNRNIQLFHNIIMILLYNKMKTFFTSFRGDATVALISKSCLTSVSWRTRAA